MKGDLCKSCGSKSCRERWRKRTDLAIEAIVGVVKGMADDSVAMALTVLLAETSLRLGLSETSVNKQIAAAFSVHKRTMELEDRKLREWLKRQ